MSDKNKILLEDRGWHQMSTLLDSELPLKKRKKRLFLWILVCGVVVLTIVLIFSKDKGSVNDLSKTPIAQVAIAPSQYNDQNALLTKNEICQDVNTLKTKRELSSKSFEKTLPKVSAESAAKISKSLAKNNTVISYGSIVINKHTSDNNILEMVTLVQPESEELKMSFLNFPYVIPAAGESKIGVLNHLSQQIEGEEKSTENARGIESSLQMLPETKNVLYSYIRKRIVIPAKITSIDEFKTEIPPKTNSYYAFTGGNIGINQEGLGYQIGVGKRLSNEDFAFFFEAGYANMNYENERSSYDSIVVDFTPEISFPNIEFDVNESSVLQNAIEQSQIRNSSTISSHNYLFLTAGLEKNISNKFIVMGGLTYARFLKVKNPTVNFTSSDGSFQSSLDQYNMAETDLFDNGDLRKYEFSGSLGLCYRLSQRVFAAAHYRIGLTNLIRNISSRDLTSSNESTGKFSYGAFFKNNIGVRISYNF